jgi:hypothetical protein
MYYALSQIQAYFFLLVFYSPAFSAKEAMLV